jgi:3-dehydroquinate synthase
MNIVLAGFMGTGKSAVGRAVAQRLGWPFLDTDSLVESALGLTVQEVFARYGEAFFRAQERQAVSHAATQRDVVIAVGGGALLEATNRAALEATGQIICLDAAPEVILARLPGASSRPLLAGSPEARVRSVLAARAAHYASLPYHVDTTGLSVAEVAERVIALASRATADQGAPTANRPSAVCRVPSMAETIPVPVPGAEYHLYLAPGLLSRAGRVLRDLGLGGRAVVVTNPVVGQLYAELLGQGLGAAGGEWAVVEMPDGEIYKTMDTVARLYAEFLRLGLERSSTVLALGGGVVGDVAGFAAATFLRGLPLVHVPTTLLAMVDSSIGGKTGVDLPGGKNLVGTFYQPRAVLCDPEVLATLPAVELRCGLAEAVKTAIIANPALFALLEAGEPWPLGDIVRGAAGVKAAIVSADPTEQGLRATLNLGHTIGHALEQASHFRYRHGEAVSIGLVGATRLAVQLSLCAPEVAERVEALLRRSGLPIRYAGVDQEKLLAALRVDKKRRGGRLRWILPVRIGEVIITDEVPQDAVLEVVTNLGG